jgi:hypothetical protein
LTTASSADSNPVSAGADAAVTSAGSIPDGTNLIGDNVVAANCTIAVCGAGGGILPSLPCFMEMPRPRLRTSPRFMEMRSAILEMLQFAGRSAG